MTNRPKPGDILGAKDRLPPENGLAESEKAGRLRADLARISEEKEELRLELQEVKLKLQTKEFVQSLAKPYASKVYWFMAAYCAFAGVLLLLDGFSYSFVIKEKELSFDLDTRSC